MEKNPVDGYMDNSLAAVFTMMLPGLGQMLKGSIIPGLLWSAAVGGAYLVSGWLGLVIHVICILDAAIMGGFRNMIKSSGWLKAGSLLMGLTILLIYTVMRTALF